MRHSQSNQDVVDANNRSINDFVERVWPRLKRMLGGGEIVCMRLREAYVRSTSGKSAQEILDMDLGIDAIWFRPVDGIYTIPVPVAIRVQWMMDPQDSFTSRLVTQRGSLETEYKKRALAIKHKDKGASYPYLTIQAFLDKPGGTLLSVAAIKTEDLYKFIEEHPELVRPRELKDGTQFVAVYWDDLRKHGVPMVVYRITDEDRPSVPTIGRTSGEFVVPQVQMQIPAVGAE